MSGNFKSPQKAGETQLNDKHVKSNEPAGRLLNEKQRTEVVIRNLLKNAPVGVDEKLTTVKVAHHVDKDRFQSAFRRLMGDTES